jgi:hypothetical protein
VQAVPPETLQPPGAPFAAHVHDAAVVDVGMVQLTRSAVPLAAHAELLLFAVVCTQLPLLQHAPLAQLLPWPATQVSDADTLWTPLVHDQLYDSSVALAPVLP